MKEQNVKTRVKNDLWAKVPCKFTPRQRKQLSSWTLARIACFSFRPLPKFKIKKHGFVDFRTELAESPLRGTYV